MSFLYTQTDTDQYVDNWAVLLTCLPQLVVAMRPIQTRVCVAEMTEKLDGLI